ncbi:hypothetical protein REPUB_Repub03eG0069700 [Reevesia pubescens]
MASSTVSAKEEQPPTEKKQKLEKDDDFLLSHYYDRETYFKLLNDSRRFDDDYDLCDGEHEMIEDEINAYAAHVEASDGFDVPEFPGVAWCGLITPMSMDEDSFEYLHPFSVAAIEVYNKEHCFVSFLLILRVEIVAAEEKVETEYEEAGSEEGEVKGV